MNLHSFIGLPGPTHIRHCLSRRLVLLVVCFILIFLAMTSCSEGSETPPQQAGPPLDPSTPSSGVVLRYLALGDSYTIGQGVDEADRWPNQLARNLEFALSGQVEVQFIAQSGWTTTSLLQAIEANDPKEQDLVSLLIGVNNQYQKVPFSRFEKELADLLKIGLDLSGENGLFFVVSIPDYGVTPFGSGARQTIREEIDRYNFHIAERCRTEGIPFIDVTSISRELADYPGSLADDRLHPSASQYTTWVETIYPVVVDLLD